MTRSKYNVSSEKDQRMCDDIVFDSQVEMRFYRDFVIPKFNNGEITHYELQKPYVLQPPFSHNGSKIKPITYVADFYIEWADGSSEVIDIKGFPDSVSKIKRKMMWYMYPDVKFNWYTYSKIDGGFCTYEYVSQQRKIRKRKRKEAKKNVKKDGLE